MDSMQKADGGVSGAAVHGMLGMGRMLLSQGYLQGRGCTCVRHLGVCLVGHLQGSSLVHVTCITVGLTALDSLVLVEPAGSA